MQTQYENWKNHPNLDAKLKEELLGMNETTIQDAFYTDIAFGTAGMRGLLGVGTNRINVHTITKANAGFAQYIVSNGAEAMSRGVAIAYDNRHMSYEFAQVSARVLASYNIRSYVFESLRPTPELSFAVRELSCFGGIVITASHNPREYNGYKLYDETGCQLVPAIAEKVISLVNAIEDPLSIKVELNAEQEQLINVIGKEIDEKYYAKVLGIQLRPELDKSNLKIVFTPQHGTANKGVQAILERAGYNVILVEEQSNPDPDFSNTKTPNPEEIASYDLALKYAHEHNADIVLSCDPDADRMGVAVKVDNDYILLTGNQTGSILIEYLLSTLQTQGKLPSNGVMFNTVVTSDLGEKIANNYGVSCEKTLTGFKFIGEKIAQYEKTQEKSFVFGYEESYGSLIAPFVRDKDALQACLILAEAACYYQSLNETLYDVLLGLYAKYGTYTEKQTSLTLAGMEGSQRLKELITHLQTAQIDEIGGIKVVKKEDYALQTINVGGEITSLTGFVKSDVIKFYLADGSWIAIRPSGTEPKCKFYYCVVSEDLASGEVKFEELKAAVAELIA